MPRCAYYIKNIIRPQIDVHRLQQNKQFQSPYRHLLKTTLTFQRNEVETQFFSKTILNSSRCFKHKRTLYSYCETHCFQKCRGTLRKLQFNPGNRFTLSSLTERTLGRK